MPCPKRFYGCMIFGKCCFEIATIALQSGNDTKRMIPIYDMETTLPSGAIV